MNNGLKRALCLGLGLTLTMVMLSGCGFNKTEKPVETPVTKPVTKPAGLVVENLEYHEVKKIDNTDVLDVSLVYPQFKNPDHKPGLDMINTIFSNDFKVQKESAVKDQMEMAKDAYEFSKESPDVPFLINSLAVGYELMNKDNSKISILQSFSVFTGGAHPNTGFSAKTYDVETGKPLKLEQITGKTSEETKTMVTDQVLAIVEKSITANEGIYNASYKNDCVQYFDSANFYLKDGKLYVFYQAYDIGPYSSGMPTFEIKLK